MKLAALLCTALLGTLVSCSSDSTTSDAQTPPTSGRTDIEKWLTDASYKTWTCEPAVHAARDPSPHGFNRICSNDVIMAAASGTGPWPKGASAVKEIYASLTATTPVGVAVYLKTAADSASGASWYWYERVPSTSDAPHDANGVVADGKGSSGTPLSICVACHGAAGSDTMHTPSPGGRDQVYTPVR
jgi:cytochrome c553